MSKKQKPIFAIDPGPVESAFMQLHRDGTIQGYGKVENLVLMDCLKAGAWQWEVAIEMIASYGMPVGQEVFDTCRWVGKFEIAAGGAVLVYRKDVKMHLCHSMRAKDSNIRQALIEKYGKPGTAKNPGPTYGIAGDVWAALAVADYKRRLAEEKKDEQRDGKC